MAADDLLLGFHDLILDLEKGTLKRGSEVLTLRSKSFALLAYFARNRGRVISKDEIVSAVWGRSVVTDDALTQTIKDLRRSLGPHAEQVIRTVPRRGYMFVTTTDFLPSTAIQPEVVDRQGAPTIAVLPLENLGGDAAQDYFAEGMAEDIITGLSRIHWLSVIASSSSFTYPAPSPSLRRISQELGARYIVRGAMRRLGDRLRITANLLVGESGHLLWAESFDGALDNVFDFLDKIAEQIVGVVEPSIQKSEIERSRRKRPENLHAYDLYLRAVPAIASQMPDEGGRAIALLDEALRMAPNYAAAHALKAWCHEWRYSRAGFDAADREAALHHARRAADSGTDDATALAIAGFVLVLLGRDDVTGLSAIERALAINPSCATAMYLGALANAFSGRPDEAVTLATRAPRFSPFDTLLYQAEFALALAKLQCNHPDEAALHIRKALQLNSSLSSIHFCAACIHTAAGDKERGASFARSGLAMEPRFRLRLFSEVMVPTVASRLAAGGKLLGLPD